MFIIRKILVYLNPFLYVLGAELIRSYQTLWWLAVVASLFLLSATVWDFTRRKFTWNFSAFLIGPAIMLLASYWFIFFVENVLLYRLIIVVAGLFLYLFLAQVLNYFYYTMKYQPYTIENFSMYIGIFTVFLASSSLLSMMIFLQISGIISAVLFFIIIFICTYQILWSNKITWGNGKLFVYILPIALVEMFVAIGYLPLNNYIAGLLMSIVFYLSIGLSKLFLIDSFSRKNIFTYIIVSVAAAVLVLGSAQWS